MFFFSSLALAQAPAAAPAPAAPPAREYSGSFGGGITLTGGNTDTRSYNLSFSHIHERKNGNTDKITALYLRGEQNDVLTLDRAAVIFRDEYKLSRRVFMFGEVNYLHDPFRDINYYRRAGGRNRLQVRGYRPHKAANQRRRRGNLGEKLLCAGEELRSLKRRAEFLAEDFHVFGVYRDRRQPSGIRTIFRIH